MTRTGLNRAHDGIRRLLNKVAPGPKLLLLDDKAMTNVSIIFGLSDLFTCDVFYAETMTNYLKLPQGVRHTSATEFGIVEEGTSKGLSGEIDRTYLHCVLMFNPLQISSIAQVAQLIQRREFWSFSLVFTNKPKARAMERLVRYDPRQSILTALETNLDFSILTPNSFHLGATTSILRQTSMRPWRSEDQATRQQMLEGFLSVLRAVLRPSRRGVTAPYIVFPKRSKSAAEFAELLRHRLAEEYKPDRISSSVALSGSESSDKLRTGTDIIYIMDRREDPVTPLLTPFTYQSQLAELLEWRDGVVTLGPKIEEMVPVSALDDPFFERYRLGNFGEITEKIMTEVAAFQSEHGGTSAVGLLSSIDALRSFMQKIPEHRQEYQNLRKHVEITHRLTSEMTSRKLFDCAALEQSLACDQQRSRHREELKALLNSGQLSVFEQMRLVLLFALRYEDDKETISSLEERKEFHGFEGFVKTMLEFSGSQERTWDVFANQSIWALTKSKVIQLKGSTNALERHCSLLSRQLQEWTSSRSIADEDHLSCVDISRKVTVPLGRGGGDAGNDLQLILSEQLCPAKLVKGRITCFCIGGVTMSEISDVEKLIAHRDDGLSITVGGGRLLTARDMLAELVLANKKNGGDKSSETAAPTKAAERSDEEWKGGSILTEMGKRGREKGVFSGH